VHRDQPGLTARTEYADGMIEHDGHVGKLLQALDDLCIAENTIVIYTTDNCPHMNSWPDAAMTPFRSEKNTNWEGAFRVPCMIRWPGRVEPGQVSTEIVSGLDWCPTLLAAAGVPDVKEKLLTGYEAAGKTFKVHLDGYNQLPFLTGQEPRSARRTSSTLTTTATWSRCATRTGRSCSWSRRRPARWRSGSSRSRRCGGPRCSTCQWQSDTSSSGRPLRLVVAPEAGFRYTYMRTELEVCGGRTVDSSESWVDPLIGSRIGLELTDRTTSPGTPSLCRLPVQRVRPADHTAARLPRAVSGLSSPRLRVGCDHARPDHRHGGAVLSAT
jgi:Sulfatase